MKWTVQVDNRTNDPVLETEHGLSVFLETERHRILLDTGASDMLIRNAERTGIDLSTVDYVFISHGHSDHAGGLKLQHSRHHPLPLRADGRTIPRHHPRPFQPRLSATVHPGHQPLCGIHRRRGADYSGMY